MRVSSTERKEQLIRATVELMRAGGVQNLSLRAIADQAGAPLATVHYCFDGKDELLAHAVEYWLRRMVDLPELDDEAMSSGLVHVALRMAESFWSALEDNPQDVLAQIELVTWALREAPNNGMAGKIYQRYEATLAELFSEVLLRSGQVTDWDPGDLGRVFIVLIDGASLQYMADPTCARHEATMRRAMTAVFSSVIEGRTQGVAHGASPADT